MYVKYFSHASVQIVGDDRVRLLTDPWLYGPVYGNMMWQFPPCPIPLEEFTKQDVLYISHTHPDHYSLKTLEHFDRNIPIIIRTYPASVPVAKELRDLGFRNITELNHRETREVFPGFKITLLQDAKSVDSAIVVQDGRHTMFMQNDCFLAEEDLAWIGKHFSIDFAGVFFMGVGPYPGSFVMSWEDKEEAIEKKKIECFERARRTVDLIGAKRVLPCSSDMTWLRRRDLGVLNGALPVEFRDYMQQKNHPAEILLMIPGESFHFKESAQDYSSFWRTRGEMFADFERLRSLPTVASQIRDFEQWERSFEFSASSLINLFNQYSAAVQKGDFYTDKLPKEDIRIGLRVKCKDADQEFIIDYFTSKISIEQVQKPINVRDGFHMLLTLPDYLLGMALSGACTFEDLVNCRYLIERPGSYNETDGLFWEYLAEFTWYLEKINQQPKMAERNKFQKLSIVVPTASGS